MKTYTLDEVQDKLIGKVGTPRRDLFEYELQMDLIGNAIKQACQERNLTQAELGDIVGVKKSQIYRIENSISDVRFMTMMKVFEALGAKIKICIELNERQFAY